MDSTELEKQVRADKQAAEELAIAQEIQRRQHELEQAQLLKEIKEQSARERLMRPMSQQAICGISSSRVVRQLPQDSPVLFIRLPMEVVAILEDAFEIRSPEALTKFLSTLVQCFAGGDGKYRKEARMFAEGKLTEPSCFVPMLVVAGYSPEFCSQLISGWSLGYRARQESRDALLKEAK